MSLERVLNTLASFGLTRTEAEVYVYLAREGPQKAETAAKSLSLNKRLVSRILENLSTKKKIVSKVSENDATFSALPFDKAIDLLVRMHLEQTRIIEQNKDEILHQWKGLMKRDSAR